MAPAGRPAVEDEKRRDKSFAVAVNTQELAAIRAAAEAAGVRVTTWAREAILRAARRQHRSS